MQVVRLVILCASLTFVHTYKMAVGVCGVVGSAPCASDPVEETSQRRARAQAAETEDGDGRDAAGDDDGGGKGDGNGDDEDSGAVGEDALILGSITVRQQP